MTSHFSDINVVGSIAQQPVRDDVDYPPTIGEIEEAASALKSNKVGGKNELTPELLKLVLSQIV